MSRLTPTLPLLLALCIGLVGSVLTYQWVQSHGAGGSAAGKTTPVTDTIKIAVAAENLAWGTKLSGQRLKDCVAMEPYLKESAPTGHFDDLAKVEDRVLLSRVGKGQPILESDLAPVDVKQGGVGALLRPGYRAMTVLGDSALGATGFIEPGDHVDILVTIDDTEQNKAITKVVLENILVLAAGSKGGERGDGGGGERDDSRNSGPDEAFTLEVSPEAGEKLALAATRGRLHFALRNALDSQEVLTRGATVSRTLDSFLNSTPPVQKSKAEARGPGTRVEVIKGTDVSSQTF